MRKNDKNIIVGRKPILEAIKRGIAVEKLLMEEGMSGSFEIQIRELTKGKTFPVQFVPAKKLNEITRANHQGAILYTALISYYRLEDVLQHVFDRGENPLILLLDNITDVRNFGAICRSAEVLGAHCIVVPKKGSAMVNEFAIKASAGALNIIPVCREKNITGAIELLKMSGVRVLSSSLSAEKSIAEVDMKVPLAVVIGSEDKGVNRAYIRQSDESFKIDQLGKTDSLNVSVATGVILYEIQRQRSIQ